MYDFNGKLALVSGGGSGIGRAIAVQLATTGATVLVQDVNRVTATDTSHAIKELGGTAMPLAFDVRDESTASQCMAEFEHVSFLVNCAGIAGSGLPVEKIDRAASDEMYSIHVWGAFNLLRTVLPGMKKHQFGRVINIASNRGQVGFELSSHYCAAKAALIGLTKAWAKELAPYNVLVNAIAPGVVRTAMTISKGTSALEAEAQTNLLKRWAEPEEIAASTLFLLGPDSSYYTGQVLSPNGGDPILG